MARLMRGRLEAGAERVVLLGSDSPTLPLGVIGRALDRLVAGVDVVLGPSFDGGYYLVGARARCDGIFEGIDWSTPRVLGQTLKRCEALGLGVELLEFWYDVDEAQDLRLLRTHLLGYLAVTSPSKHSETRSYLEALESRGSFP